MMSHSDDNASDSDGAPEEVSTSSWGKNAALEQRRLEKEARERVREAAVLKRKQTADRIRRQQEESKALRELSESLAYAQEAENEQANGDEEESDDENCSGSSDRDGHTNKVIIDYSKPLSRNGHHVQLLSTGDDPDFGRKTIDSSVMNFTKRTFLDGARKRTNGNLQLSAKRKGAAIVFATNSDVGGKGKRKKSKNAGKLRR
jgi:hypothetical protein